MRSSTGPHAASLLRTRSFRLLLAATFGGFTGYVLLLPVIPSWAVEGGAGEAAAGATNGVFMLVTVLTQLGMPWLLRRIDHRIALGLGTFLIGAPTPLFITSTDLPVLLGVSGLRGIGFGLLTVAGSALVAELVPAAQRGRAAGLYGFAAGLPNVALLPTGVWLANTLGYAPLFWIAALTPVLATAAAASMPPVSRRTSDTGRTPAATPPILLLPPWLVMTIVSLAAGGFISFVPLALTSRLTPLVLLAFGSAVVVGRWLAGLWGDRIGTRRILLPAVPLAALGLAAIALGTSGHPALAPLGAFLLGAGFGAVQNATLVVMFERATSNSASTAWNIAYDAGNGLGAVGFGLLLSVLTYPATFGVAAGLVLACVALGPRRVTGRVRGREHPAQK